MRRHESRTPWPPQEPAAQTQRLRLGKVSSKVFAKKWNKRRTKLLMMLRVPLECHKGIQRTRILSQIEPSQWDPQASCPRADFPHWRKHFNHLQSVFAHVSTFHQNHRIQSTPVRMAVQTPLPESTLNGRGGCIKVLARKMVEDDAS